MMPPIRLVRSEGASLIRAVHLLALVIACVAANVVHPRLGMAADGLHGGRFLLSAKLDSLGYDRYRSLPSDYQLERRMEAKRWARRAREEAYIPRSLDMAATAVGLCPYLPEGWVIYAYRLNELGRYVDATICLDHAERTLRFEPSKSRQRELTGDYHRLRAIVGYNQGDAQACVEHSELALEVHDDDDLRLLRARALSDLGRFDDARRLLAWFSDRSPAYARSLAVLGLVEMDQSRYEAAEDAFQRAYKYGMRGAVFDNDRGRLELAREHYDEAIEYFRSAVESLTDFII